MVTNWQRSHVVPSKGAVNVYRDGDAYDLISATAARRRQWRWPASAAFVVVSLWHAGSMIN